MKTFVAIVFFTGSFLFISFPLAAQKATNGCMEVTAFYAGLDAPVEGFEFAWGAVEISYSVTGDALKSFDVIINGQRGSFRAVGSATLVIDLLLSKGESLSVTLNTYSTPNPGKGKLCYSETKIIESK